MRYGIAGVVLGVSVLRAATGAACSEPYYRYEIESFGPDAAQVELNAPLLLTTIEQDSEWEPDRSGELDPWLELRVLGSDTPLEVLRPIQHGSTLSFVPSHNLVPNTTYSISARLVGDAAVALESEKASWQLTTGEDIRPPLAMTGDWKVTFEAAMDTQYECIMDFGSCGLGDCVAVGEGAVTKAHITLPKVVGGFAKELLTGRVELREQGVDNGPADVFEVPELEPEKAGELVVTMPLIDDKAYVPCFAFTARDARGDHPTSVYCLDEAFPEPVAEVEEPEPMPDSDPSPEPTPDPIDQPREPGTTDPPGEDNAADGNRTSPSKTSSGCSMSGGGHGVGSALGLLLGLAALSRRRQPKSAP